MVVCWVCGKRVLASVQYVPSLFGSVRFPCKCWSVIDSGTLLKSPASMKMCLGFWWVMGLIWWRVFWICWYLMCSFSPPQYR